MPDPTPPEWMPLADGRSLRIEIDESPPDEPDDLRARTDAAWDTIRAANPRAFNGPILAYTGADAATNTVHARRDEFRRLAVRPVIETGVTVLGVSGVLVAHDLAGEPHALLGMRSHSTRIFGGMWEFGPSGGVDPPPVGQTAMDADDLWRVLINEIREEVGLPVDPDPAPPLGLLDDPAGQSVELVVRVPIARPVEELIALIDVENGTSRWEYDAVRWVAFGDLQEFVRREPAIPSAVALAGLLGG